MKAIRLRLDHLYFQLDKWAGIIDQEFQGQHKDLSFNSQIGELPSPKGV